MTAFAILELVLIVGCGIILVGGLVYLIILANEFKH